jgi:hypothetical protein
VASGLSRSRAPAARVALAAAIVAACGAGSSARPGDGAPPAPTPRTSLSAQMAGTAALLRAELATAGRRLAPAVVPYRPSEPGSFSGVPRAVLQADVGGPSEGLVVIYEFSGATTAAARGQEFADHLESGFGQTNYPLDAQFSLGQVGGTIVFTWWSRELSADPSTAEAAFDAIASVGVPIPVVK